MYIQDLTRQVIYIYIYIYISGIRGYPQIRRYPRIYPGITLSGEYLKCKIRYNVIYNVTFHLGKKYSPVRFRFLSLTRSYIYFQVQSMSSI